jgi:hypothetical protein
MLGAERDGKIAGIVATVVTIVVVCAAVYGINELVRPLTATEVCKKFDAAKTAAEAKKYATLRMHPPIDAMFADEDGLDPNDTYEWTREIDGPGADTKLVGFRGTFFDREVGRRVRIEGHFVVVKSGGRKVDDVVVTGVEGQSLPGPVSLVDEHRRATTPPGTGSPAPGSRPWDRTKAGSGYQPKSNTSLSVPKKYGLEKLFGEVKDAIGWGGIVAVVVIAIAGLSIYHRPRKRTPAS